MRWFQEIPRAYEQNVEQEGVTPRAAKHANFFQEVGSNVRRVLTPMSLRCAKRSALHFIGQVGHDRLCREPVYLSLCVRTVVVKPSASTSFANCG